jgi:hypothetical protein
MEKDKNQQLESQGRSWEESSVFVNDQYYLHIYKKAQKIALAIYMISDFFAESEPIKKDCRTLALNLVNTSLSLSMVDLSNRKSLLDSLIKNSLLLISYSEIATRTGMESSMNHRIIKNELEIFIKNVEERENPANVGKSFVLDNSFVEKELSHSQTIGHPSHIYPQNSFSLNDIAVGSQNSPKKTPVHYPDKAAFKNKLIERQKNVKNEGGIDKEKNSRKFDRQEAILSVIRDKGELSIKDLTGVIKGCSEKTIQRELIVLVESGILSKTGDRRWSRYSIAQN